MGFVFLEEMLITGSRGRRWVSCFWTRSYWRTLGIGSGLGVLGRGIDHGPSGSTVVFVFSGEGMVGASCFCPKCLSPALGVGSRLHVFGRSVDYGPPRSAIGIVFLDEKLVTDHRYRRWA